MGFRIPGYLRDSLYRRFNKTEFDESVLLTTNTQRPPSYIEAAISAYGLSIRARQQPLIKGLTMFNTDSFSNTKPVFKMLDDILLKDSLIKVVNVNECVFEMITTCGLRAVHIDVSNEFELNNEPTVIIKCGDAALIVHVSGLCKSKLSAHLSLLEFKLADRPLP